MLQCFFCSFTLRPLYMCVPYCMFVSSTVKHLKLLLNGYNHLAKLYYEDNVLHTRSYRIGNVFKQLVKSCVK